MYKRHPVKDYAAVVGGDGQLIDVREPDEVAQGTLPGAINIPLGDLPSRISEIEQGRRVVLLCRSGGRSGQAAEFLMASGYPDVVNLVGGMLAMED